MNRIAEKLRQAYHNDLTDAPVLIDGAEEIDRLQSLLNKAVEQLERAVSHLEKAANGAIVQP